MQNHFFFLKELIFGVFNYISYFFNLHTYIYERDVTLILYVIRVWCILQA